MLKCYKVVLDDKAWLFLPLQDVFKKGLISANQTQTKTSSICTDELFFIYMASLASKLTEGIYVLLQVRSTNICFSALLSVSSTTPTEQ